MKLTKIGASQLVQTKKVPGLLSCEVEYEVKSGTGRLQYSGPKFSRGMWHQVLSFFRWTYCEMDSESQVRLYVNTTLGRWGAWAFPQEARTGMSAKEIPVKETPEQAVERFGSWNSEPSDDWVYFCTVHHHCAASAFQSGTDEENERNQDGLHITVGHMGSERHDLHARFYLAGNCFEPDLSLFWPIEPDLIEQLPASMLDELARFQMCEKVESEFPLAWRQNVIEIKRECKERERKEAQRSGLHLDWGLENTEPLLWQRVQNALAEIIQHCRLSGFRENEIVDCLHLLGGESMEGIVLQVCLANNVSPEDLIAEFRNCELPF